LAFLPFQFNWKPDFTYRTNKIFNRKPKMLTRITKKCNRTTKIRTALGVEMTGQRKGVTGFIIGLLL